MATGGFLGDSTVPGWGRWTGVDGTEFDAPYDLLPAPTAPAPVEPMLMEQPPPVAQPIPYPMPIQMPAPPAPRPRNPEQQLAAAGQQARESIVMGGQAEAAKAEAVAPLMEQQAVDNERRLAEREERRVQVQQLVDRDMAELGKDLEQIRAQKIDPGRFYRDMGTGQKVAAGIALAMGGFLNPRGENQALAILDRAHERELAAQQADMANQRGAFDAKRSLYATNHQRWGNDLDAMDATRLAMIDQAKLQIQAEAAKFESPIIQAKAQGLLADLDAKMAETAAQMRDRRAALAQQSADRAEQRRQFDAKLAMEREEREAMRTGRAAEADAKAAEKQRALGVDNVQALDDSPEPVMARTEAEGVKARELEGAAAGFVSNLRRLGELGDWRLLTSAEKREATALLEYLKPSFAVMLGQGAAGEKESERYEAAIGDPNSFFGNRDAVRALEQGITRQVSAKMSSYTGRKVQWKAPETGGGVKFKPAGVPARGAAPGPNARRTSVLPEDEETAPSIGGSLPWRGLE